MTTKEEAIKQAAACIREAYRLRDSLPARDAAELAHHAGGPSVDEIEQLILAQRAEATRHAS